MTSYLDIFFQTTSYLRLKVSLLQDSFVREIWNRVGKQAYLETIHPLVLSNLYNSPDKSSAASASVLLISSSEELGVPITIHQVFWFCNNLPGYLTMFSFIHMPQLLLMCNHYFLLSLCSWIRLSCLLFTALGRDYVRMALMCWSELVFLVYWLSYFPLFPPLRPVICNALPFFDFSGGIFGELFIIKQMVPLLKNVVRSFIDVSCMNKADPVQSWSALALIDCMMTLDGLVYFLTEEVIVKELLEVRFLFSFGFKML